MKKLLILLAVSLSGMGIAQAGEQFPLIRKQLQTDARSKYRFSPYLHFQWGWNGWLNNNNPDLQVKWFPGLPPASGFNLYLMFGRAVLTNHFVLGLGVGSGNSKYKFEKENLVMSNDNDRFRYTLESDSVRDLTNRSYIKSKLSMRYVDVPLDITYRTGKFEATLTLKVGYMYNNIWKRKFKDNGNREKEKINADFGLEKFRYGAALRMQYDKVGLFFYYELSPQFRDKSMPQDMVPIMFGFSRTFGKMVRYNNRVYEQPRRIDLMDTSSR